MSSTHPQQAIGLRLLQWIGLFAAWSLPVLPYLLAAYTSTDAQPTWEDLLHQRPEQSLGYRLLLWYFWVPWTFWIARLGKRFPPLTDGSVNFHYAALHGLFGLLIGPLWKVYGLTLTALLRDSEAFLKQLMFGMSGDTLFNWLPLVVYGWVLAATLAWDFYQQSQERELQLVEARMNALRAQVQPQFLFRTLHSVSALMAEDVTLARRTVARLSDLLRANLADPPGGDIALDDELRQAHRYLELEEMRLKGHLETRLEIAPDSRDAAVPHLLLQPLVENALRVDPQSGQGASRVSLNAALEGTATLRIDIDDNGPLFDPISAMSQSSLANVRARLQELYGNRASLDLGTASEGGCRCTVRLPWRRFREVP